MLRTGVRRITESLFYLGTENPSRPSMRQVALHHPDEVGVLRGLQLVFGDLLDAADEAPARGTVEEGLGVGWTELKVGDDVGLTDSHR